MDNRMAKVAAVAAEWTNLDVYWAVVHAPSRDAALAAILGNDEYAAWRTWQKSQEEDRAADERADRFPSPVHD